MEPKPFLSVVIPAYNELRRLPLTLLEIDRYLETVTYSYELIVVDDGSTDGTPDAVEQMAATIPHLRLIRNDQNRGKGAVVRQGMLAAQGSRRLFMDADNSTTIDQVAGLLPYCDQGYGVVIGSRALADSVLEPPQGVLRRTIGRLGNVLIRLINVPGVYDTQCGFKLFTDRAAEQLFSQAVMRGWSFDIEVLALARASRYTIREVPVRWVDKAGSTFHPAAYLRVFFENLTIRWKLLRGSYALDHHPSRTTA